MKFYIAISFLKESLSDTFKKRSMCKTKKALLPNNIYLKILFGSKALYKIYSSYILVYLCTSLYTYKYPFNFAHPDHSGFAVRNFNSKYLNTIWSPTYHYLASMNKEEHNHIFYNCQTKKSDLVLKQEKHYEMPDVSSWLKKSRLNNSLAKLYITKYSHAKGPKPRKPTTGISNIFRSCMKGAV